MTNFDSEKEKMYSVTFRHNRSFELHIRKNIMRFTANETKILPDSIINNPAFQQQKNNFSIKEV